MKDLTMRYPIAMLLVCLSGCVKDPSAVSLPPAPDDLSTWSSPEIVQQQADTLPPQVATPRAPTSAEKVFTYTPGESYTVDVPVGWPLDIILETGEHVRDTKGGEWVPIEGQVPPWDVKVGADGDGDTLRPHIFVAPTAPGLTLGLIVTTTRRTYYLTCRSVQKSPIRALWWKYPPGPIVKDTTRAERLLPDPHAQRMYHSGYDITSYQGTPTWTPFVVDDGRKTYLIYPERTLFEVVPLVRLVGPNGPQLVNTRQFLNVVIRPDCCAPGIARRHWHNGGDCHYQTRESSDYPLPWA